MYQIKQNGKNALKMNRNKTIEEDRNLYRSFKYMKLSTGLKRILGISISDSQSGTVLLAWERLEMGNGEGEVFALPQSLFSV